MKRSRDQAGETSRSKVRAQQLPIPILKLPEKITYSGSFGKHLVNTLRTHGCALVHCSPELTIDLAKCDILARRFFGCDLRGSQHTNDKLKWAAPCPVGSFCGYHQPSPAKEVFRYRFGLDRALHQGEWHEHDNAPVVQCRSCMDPDSCTPSDCSVNCFLKAMERGARGLRELAAQLAVVLLTATSKPTWGADDAKALLDDLIEDVNYRSGDSTRSKGFEQAATSPGFALPIPPFDAFHYFNDTDSESVSNCAPHVDPGILTLIPLADVPGLLVRPPRKGNGELLEETEAAAGYSDDSDEHGVDEWVGVEELAHAALGSSDECHSGRKSRDEHLRNSPVPCQQRLITVLAGEVLESLTAGIIPAGVHMVSRPPPVTKDNKSYGPTAGLSEIDTSGQPRFSLVFDLQVPVASAALIEAEATGLTERASRREAQPPLHSIQRVAGRKTFV